MRRDGILYDWYNVISIDSVMVAVRGIVRMKCWYYSTVSVSALVFIVRDSDIL